MKQLTKYLSVIGCIFMSVLFLLPCECGKEIPVEAGQAGETIICECGTKIEVPQLSELKTLEGVIIAEVVQDKSFSCLLAFLDPFTDRHAIESLAIFLKTILCIPCIGVAIGLTVGMADYIIARNLEISLKHAIVLCVTSVLAAGMIALAAIVPKIIMMLSGIQFPNVLLSVASAIAFPILCTCGLPDEVDHYFARAVLWSTRWHNNSCCL
jgi:hypothetical protein